MIRRQVADEFFLITQTDHAAVAGQLAAHFGNADFAAPDPRDPVLAAVTHHDAGWPLHDTTPTLNPKGLPLDVFELQRPLALKIWSASTATVEEKLDPYTALLVSLHNLALSVYATSPTSMKHEKFDMSQMTERFEVNKFQHREIERQEHLRRALRLSTDRPLKYGLADLGASPDEDELLFNFRLLQAMDLLSLGLCCTAPPTDRSMDLHPRPGDPPTHLKMRRAGITLHVHPWPFAVERIDLRIPHKLLPARPYSTDDELRTLYAKAPQEAFPAALAPEP